MTTVNLAAEAQGLLDASPMTRAQIVVVCVAILLAALDGFDVLGMAFVAPAVSHAWHLNKAVLGLLLSTSLLGMAIGSIGLSPLADVTGRKPAVFGGILLMILGSLLSAFSHSVPELAVCRILTGLGIGIMVPLTTTLEFGVWRQRQEPLLRRSRDDSRLCSRLSSNDWRPRRRRAAQARYDVAGGLPVRRPGGRIACCRSSRLAFQDPPSYLISRRTTNVLERLNRVLTRLGRPPLSALPDAPPIKRASYAALFTPSMIGTTLTFTAVMALVSAATYYLLNWLPQMITDAGFSPSQGSLVSAMPALVGMISGLIWGLAANRFGPGRLAAVCAIGSGCTLALFGFTPPILGMFLLVTGVAGIFAGGAAGLFYATMAATLPAPVRVSGIGFVIGVGRVFSILGPMLAGLMFAGGLTRLEVSLIFGCAPILAGLLLFGTARLTPATAAVAIAKA